MFDVVGEIVNKDVVIPEWIGKTNVHEDRETTLELLNVYADLVEEPLPELSTGLNNNDFLKETCDIANKFNIKIKDIELPEMGIWVGFPETPIGRLNAKLAGIVWLLKRAEEEDNA